MNTTALERKINIMEASRILVNLYVQNRPGHIKEKDDHIHILRLCLEHSKVHRKGIKK